MASTPTPFTLPQCSVKYLKELVGSPNWAVDLFCIRHGGDALELIPETENAPAPLSQQAALADPAAVDAYTASVKEWADKLAPEFALSEKQKKAVQKCIKHYIPKGALPPGKYTTALYDAFDIFDDESSND